MTPSDRSLVYRIRINGQLDERWLRWFDGLTISQLTDCNETVIEATLDQSGLHGLLNRFFDLGIELIAVQSFPISSEPDVERKEQ